MQQEDGSFFGDQWGEVDTRFSFCAVATLALLHRLNEVDVEKATSFVVSCMNFDGGFGCRPGSESHSGQVRQPPYRRTPNWQIIRKKSLWHDK